MFWPFRGKACHPLARQQSDSGSRAAPRGQLLQAHGGRSYKHIWQLFGQKGKVPRCQNRLPLGTGEELISTISQGVLGSEPREWTSSGSRPVFMDWSLPLVQQLRHALLDSPHVPPLAGQHYVLYSTLWSFWKGTGYTFTKQCKAYIPSASFQHW